MLDEAIKSAVAVHGMSDDEYESYKKNPGVKPKASGASASGSASGAAAPSTPIPQGAPASPVHAGSPTPAQGKQPPVGLTGIPVKKMPVTPGAAAAGPAAPVTPGGKKAPPP